MSFRILQDGLEVARADRWSEIIHYHLIYSEDGPVTLQERQGKCWKTLENYSQDPTNDPAP